MKIHEEPKLFRNAIILAANEIGLNPSQIEKDYWTTEILRMLSTSIYKDNVYFAGGTSLMKAYKVIRRFSEDLDLYVDTNNLESGQNTENALNSKIYNKIIDSYPEFRSNTPNTATGGTRRIHLETNKLFKPADTKPHLLIESSITTTKRKFPTYHPWEERTINSLLMEYLEKTNEKWASEYENKPFTCRCMSPKETICAKISRLTRTSTNPESFGAKIRDLYDITNLLSRQEYIDFINSEEFMDAMFKTNMQDWLQHRRIHTQMKYSESTLFAKTEELLSNKTVKKAYKNLDQILFKNETLPTLENVMTVIDNLKKRILSFDELNEMKKDSFIYAEFNNYFKNHESNKISISNYEFLKIQEKITGRLCHITKNEIPKTLIIDYQTGDICISPLTIKQSTIIKGKWKTLDGKPAAFNNTRVVAMIHKNLLRQI